MRWIMRGFIAFELVRLMAWLCFLGYIAVGYVPDSVRQNETEIFVVLGAFVLGFPYSWIVAVAFGSWDIVQVGSFVPLRIAFAHFFLWASVTTAVGFLLGRHVRRLPTPRRPAESG